ncbi:MAG TPA: rod shape-determining protein [Candidatus Faecivicinus avistercoris]|nr:rod shape-determining protein [Candidatus Faecivicinus avistercoris]
MGVFSSGGVGIDMGSANVTICLQNEGVVLREPSYVLTLRDDLEEILAVGRDARQMLGRTPRDVTLLSPIMDGAVGNIELATVLLRSLAEKALGKRRALEKNRLVVSISQGCTRVEQEALEATVRAAGAKKAALLRTPVAAALGAGVPIEDERGCMMIVIGGSTTEVSVLSMNGIAAARATRTGGLALDEAIMRYVRREKGLIIGQRTAEDLKLDLGTARDTAMLDNEEASLRGRDARTGKPSTVGITARDIRNAIMPPMEALLESIREAFENTPAEMAEDILQRGVFLSGGGALLDGLADRLGEMLGMTVTVGENPQDDVAVGTCIAAADDHIAARFAQSGCLIEL